MDDSQEMEKKLMDSFMLFFGASGGKVEGYKKLKATYFMLEKEPELPKYAWPWDFWGPDDPNFFYDVDELVRMGLVERTLGFAKNEPIHHPHNLSPLGFDYFTNLIRKLRKENPEVLWKFLPYAIAWLRLPSSFAVNKALIEIDRQEKKDIKYSENLRKIRHPRGFFTSETVHSIVRFYQLEEFDPKVSQHNGIYEIRVEIPPSIANRKYHYLILDKEKFEHEMARLNMDKLFDESFVFNFLEKNKLIQREHVKKLQNHVCESFVEELPYMVSAVNKRIEELRALFNITSGHNLSLEIHEDFCQITIGNDYVNTLKEKYGVDWKEHYIFQYWHILQPYELRDALQFFTADYLHSFLKGS